MVDFNKQFLISTVHHVQWIKANPVAVSEILASS